MDYAKDLQDIKDWAKNLLIMQYHNAPKNKKTIDLMVDLIFANNLIPQIRDLCLSVENSIGKQLDDVGKWVGIDRYFSNIDLFEHKYTSVVNYTNIEKDSYGVYQGGFSNFLTFEDNDGGFLTYAIWQDVRTAINKIGDNLFRPLIKLKILKNNIIHTCKNIDDAIYKWSNGRIYTTWGVMEVTYHYPSDMATLISLALTKNILLAPTGVTIKLEEIE